MNARERELTHAALAEQARAEKAEAQRDRLRAALEAQLAAPFSVGSHDSGNGVTHRIVAGGDDGARTGCRKCLADEQARAAIALMEVKP